MSDPRSEPSMEDILASIKRIIADDSPLPRRNFSPPPGPIPAEPVADPIPVPQMSPPAGLESQKPAEHWAESRPPFPPRAPAAPVPPRPPVAPEPADDSILELTNHIPNISPPPRPRVDDHVWPTVQPEPAPPESRSEPPAVRRVVERLRQSEAASSQARAASMAAVASIAEPAVASPAAPSLSSLIINPAGTGQTLEGLVRDMLRPMLSDWIDTNLPGIVERLVKQEMSGTGDDQL